MPGVNVFTIKQKLLLRKRILTVITFTDGSQMNIMYFGFDKNGLGDFLFSFAQIKPKHVFCLKAKEGGFFRSDEDFRYTFQVSHLSGEEATISPTLPSLEEKLS